MTASHDMSGLCHSSLDGDARQGVDVYNPTLPLMSRAVLFRIYMLAAIVIALGAVVWTVSVESWAMVEAFLVYAAFVAVAAWLRVDDETPGFEAAVVFAAILLLHDPEVALIA